VDPDGSFLVEGLLDVPQEIMASASGHPASPITTVAAGTQDARLTLPDAYALRVRATDAQGVPLQRFDVRIAASVEVWSWFAAWRTLHTDTGVLDVQDLSSHTVAIQVVAPNLVSVPDTRHLTPESPMIELCARLEPARALRGVVKRADTGT